MKKVLSFLSAFLFCFIYGFGQDHPIEILKEQKDNIIVLSAKSNDQDSNYKVELNIVCTGFKMTKSVPVVETVLAGETLEMIQLIAKPGEAASLKYSYKMTKVSNIAESMTTSLKRTESKIDEETALEQGIVLFTEFDCEACKSAKDYLASIGKDYKEINIKTNQSNKLLLWRRLERLGYKEKSVAMPVVVVEGEMHYNIKDLKAFLEALE